MPLKNGADVNHEEARRSRSNLTSKPNDAIQDAFSTVNPQVEGHRPQTVADAGTPKEVLSVSTRACFISVLQVCLTQSTWLFYVGGWVFFQWHVDGV